MSAIKYFIYEVSDVTPEMWEAAVQEPATARYSLDGTKVVLKYPVDVQPEGGLTSEEVRPIMASPEWSSGE